MADSKQLERLCACGCGQPLNGQASQKYASEGCRKRARRAAQAVPAPPAAVIAVADDERVRPALDRWIEQQDDLPEPLVAAAKALAVQVDMQPKNSPLWGRLTTILSELMAPALQGRAWRIEQRQLVEQIAIAGHDDRWRAAKFAEAKAAGMPTTPWERVVPISCARGHHSWRRRDYWGVVRCEHCDTERAEP